MVPLRASGIHKRFAPKTVEAVSGGSKERLGVLLLFLFSESCRFVNISGFA